MNGDEAMMVAGSNLYRRVSLMLNLSANVAEHLSQPHRNFEPGHAYILVRAARFSRPFPSLIEHAAVHDMNEALIQWIAAASREQPCGRLENVCFLVLVELALQREMRWDKPFGVVQV